MLASRGGLAQRVGEILEYLFGYKPACRSTIERVNAGIRLDNKLYTADTNMVTKTNGRLGQIQKCRLHI